MATLVIDLDLTVFVDCTPGSEDLQCLHNFHVLSEKRFLTTVDGNFFLIKIINLSELSALIQHACDEHDDIIFLTSGRWNGLAILKILADNLDLTESAREKLRKSYFHSVDTDRVYFPERGWDEIRWITKDIRLSRIVKHRPELRDRRMVVLDDNPEHIAAFRNLDFVTPIHATTDKPDKSFYEKTISALQIAKLLEQEDAALEARQFVASENQTDSFEMEYGSFLYNLFPQKKKESDFPYFESDLGCTIM